MVSRWWGNWSLASSRLAGVGVVEDDRVDVEFLGGDLEVVAARAGDHHAVARVAEPLRDRAPEIGIAAGEQHVHHQDLLVFDAEPSESADDVTGQ